MDRVRTRQPVRLAFALSAAAVSGLPAAAIADDGTTVVDQARTFLGEVRAGSLPRGAEVILNADGAQKRLSKAEASKLLQSCREDVLRWRQILNRDGSATPNETTVDTRFTCRDDLARYTGSVGIVLLRDGKIIRLIFQVDGYAAPAPRN